MNDVNGDEWTETPEVKGVKSSRLLATDFRALYEAVNNMMSVLGANGTINTRNAEVSKVMDALHDLDEGVYDAERIFGS